MKFTNALIHETSPYLLQHAHNPVNWVPFGPEAFEEARREHKMVLISIGYSACHWCHVMEHESFEDEEIAKVMNAHFVCIKVDREERPDVDMLYMQAVQLMTGQGGWPLNCFTLADGRPVYGGTYFQKHKWLQLLNNLQHLFHQQPEKVLEYAEELTAGLKQSERIIQSNTYDTELRLSHLSGMINRWKQGFDSIHGGPNRAPKFPLPSNYVFLLRYAHLSGDETIMDHVTLTLRKMAHGGIYDQLHGGFARYSTDVLWKVPHFEKMLYDNAQLVSLYAEAWQCHKNPLYLRIVHETLDFIKQEWLGPDGQFYSALDADSEGEEGKYYVWKKEELEDVLGEDAPLFMEYYSVNDTGYWEHRNYILMHTEDVNGILFRYQLNAGQLNEKIVALKTKLKTAVKQRVKPGLDDKTVTAWQALCCKAFTDGYLVSGNTVYFSIAQKGIDFLCNTLLRENGALYRTYKNGIVKINGFLDDYAFTIEALISFYKASADETYLYRAKSLCEYVLKHFRDTSSVYFHYTHQADKDLIIRNTEVSDNVIPSSNSQMAVNLWQLGNYFGEESFLQKAIQLLHATAGDMEKYGPGYSNWGNLALQILFPHYEVAIVGKSVDEKILEWHQHYIPNAILAVAKRPSELALTKYRWQETETLIHVCRNNTCQLPVNSVNAALQQFEKLAV